MKIAIIGAGNMGSALAVGLAKGTLVPTEHICVSNPSEGKLMALKEQFPDMFVTQDNVVCIQEADIIVLAVKPWKLEEVAGQIEGTIDFSRQTICSMVGGKSIADLMTLFGRVDHPTPGAFYTIIPNTAISVGQSMTFLASRNSTEEMDHFLLSVFNELGEAMLVEERQLFAGMILASCGIANALRYVRAATEGGVQLGFRAGEAQHIVAQTLRGAVALLDCDGAHAEAEIDKVTTPGGLTIRGLNAMEQAGFTNAVIRGLLAAMPESTSR